MPSVAVPAEFFRAELRMYGDWREALARELLQNSFDAGSTKVEISCFDHENLTRVVVADDGCGMSRSVLEDVFFALGRTTKTGTETVGGFGRARIITCFAQTKYEIHTGQLRVSGNGGNYEIEDSHENKQGCVFTIDLIDSETDRTRRAFERVLRTCTPSAEVVIEQKRAEIYTLPARAVRVLRDDQGEWAKVYVKREATGRMLVRAGGVVMFQRFLPGYDDVIVELTKSRSREILAASRDRLHDTHDHELERLVAEITIDRRSALRNKGAVSFNQHISRGGFFVSSAPVKEEIVAAEALVESLHVVSDNAPARASDIFSPPDSEPRGQFDVFLLSDNFDARAKKLARRWDPRNWEPGPSRRKRLLLTWQAAVNETLKALLELRPALGSLTWTVGWVFDADTEAAHKSFDNAHVLALNPHPTKRDRPLSSSSAKDRSTLIALAAHEVCHIVADVHDESFASLLTDLYAAIDHAAAQRALRNVASTL